MIIDSLHPTEQELRAIDIHQLLPQQEPFVMISHLVQFDEKRTVTEFYVDRNNLFVEEGKLLPEGMIESIAQTCAARIGYVNEFILKKGVQIGYIGSIRNMDVQKLPKVGDTITTVIDVQEEVFGMTLVNAKVIVENQTVVSTEMKIAIRDEN